jgi:hypothetical protein
VFVFGIYILCAVVLHEHMIEYNAISNLFAGIQMTILYTNGQTYRKLPDSHIATEEFCTWSCHGQSTDTDRDYMKTHEYLSSCVRFKVLTAVAMKSSIFSDIMACSPLQVIRCFGLKCNSIFRFEE